MPLLIEFDYYMNKPILFSIALFIVGNILAWFQAQFISEWWYEHPITTVLMYSIPTSFAFYFGWRYAVEFTGSLWSARMLGFGVSTIIFGILSYTLMNEGLSVKNGLCLILSIAIILIQLLWKS